MTTKIGGKMGSKNWGKLLSQNHYRSTFAQALSVEADPFSDEDIGPFLNALFFEGAIPIFPLVKRFVNEHAPAVENAEMKVLQEDVWMDEKIIQAIAIWSKGVRKKQSRRKCHANFIGQCGFRAS